jgi:hypothetical protein
MKYTILFDTALFTCSILLPGLFITNIILLATVAGFIYFSVWQYLMHRTPHKKPRTILRRDFEFVVRRLHLEIHKNQKLQGALYEKNTNT